MVRENFFKKGHKGYKHKKQTPEHIRKRVESRKITIELNGKWGKAKCPVCGNKSTIPNLIKEVNQLREKIKKIYPPGYKYFYLGGKHENIKP